MSTSEPISVASTRLIFLRLDIFESGRVLVLAVRSVSCTPRVLCWLILYHTAAESTDSNAITHSSRKLLSTTDTTSKYASLLFAPNHNPSFLTDRCCAFLF